MLRQKCCPAQHVQMLNTPLSSNSEVFSAAHQRFQVFQPLTSSDSRGMPPSSALRISTASSGKSAALRAPALSMFATTSELSGALPLQSQVEDRTSFSSLFSLRFEIQASMALGR